MRLCLQVRADGTVGAVQVVESSGSAALDDAAVTVARTWRFQAAVRDGQQVDAAVNRAVVFRLE